MLLFLVASQLPIMFANRYLCCGKALRHGSSRHARLSYSLPARILFELYLVSYSKADDRFLSNGGDAGITMHENL
ncbi:hypothetical protein RJ639_004591 [Escallonia herrerae]|uniref:Secreted protein n=1 Tax=Escallonia herrerae TaxID=1293975 RepID=A0AA88W002_9ASTE|nr:hypothetical protein RJ639_004591 [Escallonia herrerae]